MGIGAFTDRSCRPSGAEVAECLGTMEQLWQALIQHIRMTYPGQEDFKFCYGKRYGWALTFRSNRGLLTALYPTGSGFTVQVIVSRAALKEPQTRKLGNSTRQAMERAKLYAEGKWLFIPVQSDPDLRDVKYLLELKTRRPSESKTRASTRISRTQQHRTTRG